MQTNLAIAPRTASPDLDPKRLIAGIIEGLQRREPSAGEDQIASLLATELEVDHDLLRAAAAVLVHSTITMRHAQEQTEKHRTPAARAHRREEVEKLAAKAKAKLLDLVMPMNQKALRFCLSSEVATWGGGFARIAAAVPASRMIGEVLTDQEAAKLFKG